MIEPKVENSGIPQGMNDISTVVCVIYLCIINILHLENISVADGGFCEGAYRFSIQWQYGRDSAHIIRTVNGVLFMREFRACSFRKIFEIEVIAQ